MFYRILTAVVALAVLPLTFQAVGEVTRKEAPMDPSITSE
jgi:hypothetical protein